MTLLNHLGVFLILFVIFFIVGLFLPLTKTFWKEVLANLVFGLILAIGTWIVYFIFYLIITSCFF